MNDLTPQERIRREAEALEDTWRRDPRWSGIRRLYSAQDVIRLRGSIRIEHTLARRGAENLWRLVREEDFVAALGCLTGGQAVETVKAGLQAIYLSGWQVAADANLSGQTYPDQSLYPANSVPALVRRLNNAMERADQIAWTQGATLLTSDVDSRDREWITEDERTPEGYFHVRPGIASAIARALAYAPHAGLLWCGRSTPARAEARTVDD